MNPDISIIVPCYNQAPYLEEALESILTQTYKNWECLIVNDSSPDNTEEIAKKWTAKDSRFQYLIKPNSGVSDTRNFGIKRALGKYILPLDADDKIDAYYLQEAIAAFEKNPDIKLIYCNRILFGLKNDNRVCPPFVFENMLTENQIHHAGIFKKEDFLKTNGYNTNMVEGLEDWDFWLELIKPNDTVVKLDGFHYYYRIKKISRSTLIDREKNEKLLIQIFKNHIPLFLEYMNPIRDHIEADYYKKEVESYKTCAEYKVGSIILFPFRLIAKVFRKVAGK